MQITLNDRLVFVSTGGRPLPQSRRPALFLHGSGQSHISFLLQGRFLANRGFGVINPDMPGHGQSQGAPLSSIEEMAEWYLSLCDALGVQEADLIGHSQGGLVALEIANKAPERVKTLTLIATAAEIPVNPSLLELAKSDEIAAMSNMLNWGNGKRAHLHHHALPGVSHLYFGKALMMGNALNALYTDLCACANYKEGARIAATLDHPAYLILAREDNMTPISKGRALAESLKNSTVTELPYGHMLPAEAPDQINRELQRILA